MPRKITGQPELNKTLFSNSLIHVGALALALGLSGALAGCTSGDGGDNGHSGPGNAPGVTDPGQAGGLTFSYPVDGQTDVYPGSQIAFSFPGDASGKVKLVDANGNVVPTTLVDQGNGIFNLRVTDSDAAMSANTQYAVKADGKIGSGNTQFKNNQTLFSFTTAPAPGAASKNGFQIVSHRGDKNDRYPFTQFNPIRAQFSESVDEGTIKLCAGNENLGDDNCTVAVTGPDGNVPGRLTVLGRNFVFDPGEGHVPITSDNAKDYADQDLAANTQYKVAFSDDVHSVFGDSLKGKDSFTVTPVSIGDDSIQRLRIGDAGNGSNPLNGRKRNNIELASQLIGSYELAASQLPSRGGLKVRLASPGKSAYKNTFPTLLPRGQAFQLSSLKLKLGSQLKNDGTFSEGQVNTPINLDNLTIQFANDVDAFITANDLRNIAKPTRVQLRLDLNIYGTVPQGSPIAALSNGAVNQTALNIIASGIAVPQDNGDVSLVTLGSFPIKVNRDGVATTNFELELTLPASANDQPDVRGDQTAPFITAQYPSACSYVFNSVAIEGQGGEEPDNSNARLLFDSGSVVGGISGTTTLSAIEANCLQKMAKRNIISTNERSGDDMNFEPNPDATYNFPNAWANSLPLDSAPSILFSEPVDPESLNGNITLADEGGTQIPSRVVASGSSVTLYPVKHLRPDTKYTLSVGASVTDFSKNPVNNTSFPDTNVVSSVTFTTEPMVVPMDDSGEPVTIDPEKNELVRQTAPFLTQLTPGLPCALQSAEQLIASSDNDGSAASGNYFRNGGTLAGRCIGDTPHGVMTVMDYFGPNTVPAAGQYDYSVFGQAENLPVTGYFSKPVRSNSLVLADGCLVGGAGNNIENATIAIQVMDGGQCTGIVPGALATLNSQSSLTRGFQFTPNKPFAADQRYWVVICGSNNPLDPDDQAASECSTGKTIVGQSGLALNTTPLLTTGTQVAGFGSDAASASPACNGQEATSPNAHCFSPFRGGGGPDILMPFQAQPATSDYVSSQFTLPETDTNGNGFFDNTVEPNSPNMSRPGGGTDNYSVGGQNTDQDRSFSRKVFGDELGRERYQSANVVFSQIQPPLTAGGAVNRSTGFLGGVRPIRVEQAETGAKCSTPVSDITFENGDSVLGSSSPSQCIPVALPPGGFTTVSSIGASGGALATGRLLLRYPNLKDSSGSMAPQRGYIVPKCAGTDTNGQAYDFEPCFVADLILTVNGPDGEQTQGSSITIYQQDINLKVYGPVAFEQDGRLAISVKNARGFNIASLALLGLPLFQNANTKAGDQALQLVGSPIHGGRAFSVR